VDSLVGGYSEDRFISSFVGYGPSKQPHLVILVVIDEPQGIPYGGTVAGPVFKNIAERSLPYLNIPPTEATTLAQAPIEKKAPQPLSRAAQSVSDQGMMPDLRGLSMRSALNKVQALQLPAKVSGTGRVIDQHPSAGTRVEKGDACFLTLRPDF
jgi:hypothetical protein